MTLANSAPAGRTHTGGCLCGGVRYEVKGALRNVIACHCSQCRRTSGHFAAFSSARAVDIVLSNAKDLRWYKSSDTAERGFCGNCGSNLFWRQFIHDRTSIAAGTLDLPTGLVIEEHIFVGDKADYYLIEDGVPQKHQWD